MKSYRDTMIIGIDHGYGNVKTAGCCFPTGISAFDDEPVFKDNLLIYQNRYYLIGEGHKAFAADKTVDEETYILTLAAMARELSFRNLTEAKVLLAVGLPLTWVSTQKEQFKAYLCRNRRISFTFRGKNYSIEIVGAEVFPQGFAAVAQNLSEFKGTNMLCDIGNGTMNILMIQDRKPVAGKMFTEKYGTHQCMLMAKEAVMRTYHVAVPESIVTEVLRYGTADIRKDILETIRQTAGSYVDEIFHILYDHEYSPELMKLHIIGGGGCLIRNFAEVDSSRVKILSDICATAKGYEYMAEMVLRKRDRA
jgi:plasmid segregation protein ParM